MARVVRYKRPRKINVVTVTLALLLGAAGYLVWQYLPLYLKEQEAYRVLEETGSKVAGRIGRYRSDAKLREGERKRMLSDLVRMGITDPNAEVWLEVEKKEVRVGVVYSEWVQWPMDLIPREEKVYEVEHIVRVP